MKEKNDTEGIAPSVVYETPPVWIRPPKAGRICRHFGFSRTGYYDLIKRGHIASKCVKDPGKLKGVRLINYQSVKNYIESLPYTE
jgi:hypothetical protein